MRITLQVISSLIAIITLVCMAARWRKRRRWLSSVPSAMWLAHVILFYAYVIGYRVGWYESSPIVTTWSSAVTLHGVIVAWLYQRYSMAKRR